MHMPHVPHVHMPQIPHPHINQESIKSFSSKFQQFSDGTHIHGLHELYYAKTWFWRIVWLIIVSCTTGLTIYHVYKAIYDYIEQSSVTVIQPVDPGGLIYPPVSVCLIHWMTWVDFKKASALGFTKEMLLVSFSFIAPVYSPTLFNVDQVRIDLFKNMETRNITTFSDLYRSIARPFPQVLALLGGGTLITNPTIFTNITFRMTNTEIYLCYQMSGDDILETLDERRRQSAAVRTSSANVYNFSIQDPLFSMYSANVTESEYDYYIGWWLLTKTNYWMVQLSDYKKNFTTFTFPFRVYPDAHNDKYVEVSKENDAYTIEMRPSVHRWMNTAKNPCKEGEKSIASEHVCQDICKANYMKQMNVCLTLDIAFLIRQDIPDKMCPFDIKFLSIIFNETTQPEPAPSTFVPQLVDPKTVNGQPTATLLTKELEDEYYDCTNKCIATCEIWKYEYTSSITTLASDARRLSFKNQTDVSIVYPEESDVLVMIDQDSRTWEDFVANVGGLLGVWTGASILTFLQLFYLCFCADMECSCCSRSSVKSFVDHTQGSFRKQPRVERLAVSSIPTVPSYGNMKVVQIKPLEL